MNEKNRKNLIYIYFALALALELVFNFSLDLAPDLTLHTIIIQAGKIKNRRNGEVGGGTRPKLKQTNKTIIDLPR